MEDGARTPVKKIAKETEELKVEKFKQMKVLKKKNNVQDHKQKLQTGKENDLKRCQSAKQTKFQGGLDQMGVLHGKLQKQVVAN
jgi:hypothetical protein